MKKYAVVLLGAGILFTGILHAQGKPNAALKFYGKVSSIDLNAMNLTVFNKTKNAESKFKLMPETEILFDKKPVPSSELKVGSNLIVNYVMENNQKVAEKITLRKPGGRKAADRDTP